MNLTFVLVFVFHYSHYFILFRIFFFLFYLIAVAICPAAVHGLTDLSTLGTIKLEVEVSKPGDFSKNLEIDPIMYKKPDFSKPKILVP